MRIFAILKIARPSENVHTRNLVSPTLGEEWIVALCSLWFIGGLYLDGWAHNHLDSALETFFTPWHAVFYAGYFASAVALFLIAYRHLRSDGNLFDAIPRGFGFALIGTGLFFVGGIGDMLWHTVFGVEADIDALLSPTHLLLGVGAFLMVSANVRSWLYAADERPTLTWQLPMILSLALTLSVLTFMTQYSHFIEPFGSGLAIPPSEDLVNHITGRAFAGYLLQSIFLMGSVFLILRRAPLAPGILSILFTLNVLGMALMRDGLIFVPAAVIAGIVADIMALSLFPLQAHLKQFRIFSFLVPAILFGLYILLILATKGTWWSMHARYAAPVYAGLAGLLLSFVAVPGKAERRL